MNYSRLKAIAKRIRRGESSAEARQVLAFALGKAAGDRAAAERHEKMIAELVKMSESPLAKLVKPLNPPEGYESVAVFDGDGVSFMYENCETGDTIEIAAWPFDKNYVWPDDCEAAGIRVE